VTVKFQNVVVKFQNVVVKFQNVVVKFQNDVLKFQNVVVKFQNDVVKFQNDVVKFQNVVVKFQNVVVKFQNVVVKFQNDVLKFQDVIMKIFRTSSGTDGHLIHLEDFSEVESNCHAEILLLTESDIPGASLNGKDPRQLNLTQLKRWLSCRGEPVTGKKPELIER